MLGYERENGGRRLAMEESKIHCQIRHSLTLIMESHSHGQRLDTKKLPEVTIFFLLQVIFDIRSHYMPATV